ncbi:MAG: pentapeptide repeat-containing protein [Alphaproteobacteria bacterium]|nr:pentapeptide repeat-containing protein [Alphaproteobacteria bacterium]
MSEREQDQGQAVQEGQEGQGEIVDPGQQEDQGQVDVEQLQQLQAEVEALRAAEKRLASDNEALRDEGARLSAQARQARKDADQASQQAKALETSLQAERKAVERLETKMVELETRRQALETSLQENTDRLTETEAKLTETEEELETKTTEADGLKRDLKQVRRRLWWHGAGNAFLASVVGSWRITEQIERLFDVGWESYKRLRPSQPPLNDKDQEDMVGKLAQATSNALAAYFNRIFYSAVVAGIVSLSVGGVTLYFLYSQNRIMVEQTRAVQAQVQGLTQQNEISERESQAARRTQLISTIYDEEACDPDETPSERCPMAASLRARSEAALELIKIDKVHGVSPDISSSQLSGASNFMAVDWTDINASGADLSNTTMNDATLDGSNLSGVVLSGAGMSGVRLRHSILYDVDFTMTVFHDNIGALFSSGYDGSTDRSRSVFHGSEITKANFTDSVAPSADFGETFVKVPRMMGVGNISYLCFGGPLLATEQEDDLERRFLGADFSRAVLLKADFTGAKLPCSVFQGAHLQGATLCGANLGSSDFRGTVFTDTQANDADICDAVLKDILYDSSTVWPKCFDPPPSRDGYDYNPPADCEKKE